MNMIRKPKRKIYLDITNYNVNTRPKINAEQINNRGSTACSSPRNWRSQVSGQSWGMSLISLSMKQLGVLLLDGCLLLLILFEITSGWVERVTVRIFAQECYTQTPTNVQTRSNNSDLLSKMPTVRSLCNN